jgi:hypothetical protein
MSIQFLLILHGAMEIAIDTSTANAEWKPHLKSQKVWAAAKLYAYDPTPAMISH